MKYKYILKNIAFAILMLSINGCLGGSGKDDAQTIDEINTTKPTDQTTTTNPTGIDVAPIEDNVTTQTQEANTATGIDTATPQTDSLTLSSPKTDILKDESITLSIKDKKGNDIKNNITWIVNPTNSIKHSNTNTITPIKDTVITLKAKHNNITSNTITINVKWIVNGHTLPPKPDEKINNSTLLGMDTNNNGVRDDVERWIYETYNHPIERGIFMQSAKVFQILIKDPSKAHETVKFSDKQLSCLFYWKYDAKKNNENFTLNPYRDLDKEIESIQFNTAKRFIAYDRYNREFHGEVFGVTEASRNNCEFDNNGNLR